MAIEEGVPSGTVTFLFTDVERSTRLWEAHPDQMHASLARHDAIVRSAIEGGHGYVFSTAGDSFAAAFSRSADAAAVAVGAQRRLQAEAWPTGTTLSVRMALHTGEAHERDGDYFGPALNRTARLMAVAVGGQVLVSSVTAELLTDRLPDGVGLRDLGERQLKDLDSPTRVWELTGEGLTSCSAAVPSAAAGRGNLPVAMSELFGREPALAKLTAVISEHRLVTLTGVGGVGKSRLALEAGTRLADHHPDGVWLIPLAPVVEAARVDSAVAGTLGVRIQPGLSAREAIVQWLRGRRALLIVDNCEHVIDAASLLITAVVTGAPTVTVVATSREPLGLIGEQMWSVQPLDLAAAVELIGDRAGAADAEFVASDEDRASITRVCRRLDGIPLAIELAASRMRAMTPQDLADRLDDCFALLRTGRRRGPERHRTLRATVDWSYELLDPVEQRTFELLSVFAGSFDLRAAEAVAAVDGLHREDVDDVLGSLVDKSMVVADRRRTRVRYRLLEPLRQYAEERLSTSGSVGSAHDRHLDHYVAVAARADELFTGTDWHAGTLEFETEWENLRSAFGWAIVKRDLDAATRLHDRVRWYAILKLRHESFEWATAILELAGELGRPLSVVATGVAAWWAVFSGDADRGLELATAAIEAAPAPTDPDTNWSWHARCAVHADRARADFEASVAGWSAASQRDVFNRSIMSCYRARRGTPDEVDAGARVAAELAARHRNPSLDVWASWAAGMAAQAKGDLDEALAAFRRTHALAESADHRNVEGTVSVYICRASAALGGPIEAVDYVVALTTCVRHRQAALLSYCLLYLARHLLAQGGVDPAATILGYLRAAPGHMPGLNRTLRALGNDGDAVARLEDGVAYDMDQITAYAIDRLGG